MDKDLFYKIAITKIPMIGPVLTRTLIDHVGDLQGVFEESTKNLVKIPGIGAGLAHYISNFKGFAEVEEEMKYIEKKKIRVLFYLDNDYPQRLKQFQDSPVLLYYKGNADLNAPRILAIVGTRKPTNYGKVQCEALVDHLKNYNVVVVSGLAYGIDITAHKRCLSAGVATVGVLGSGLGSIYPGSHRNIAERMLTNGGILTEFTHKIPPDAPNFPTRNRIIAGLSDAVVVIESRDRGGSMITAAIANEYYKDVFAVPGRMVDSTSAGCNILIATNKAILMPSPQFLVNMMGWDRTQIPEAAQGSLFNNLNDKEQQVYELLNPSAEISIDKIYKNVTFSTSEVAAILLTLECRGLIKALPGKRYLAV